MVAFLKGRTRRDRGVSIVIDDVVVASDRPISREHLFCRSHASAYSSFGIMHIQFYYVVLENLNDLGRTHDFVRLPTRQQIVNAGRRGRVILSHVVVSY